jgi:DNA-binding SARP family transcriptional activator
MFRLLLLQPGQSVHREQLFEALWPEQPPASAQALFHQATSALRRALEPALPDKFPSRYLSVEHDQVTLHLPAGSTMDWRLAEQALDAAMTIMRQPDEPDINLLQEAIELYQGDLFPADRFVDWAIGPRERLSDRFERALLHLAERQLDISPRDALDTCQQLLTRVPWQEDGTLLAMRASLALGDRPRALRLYRALEQTLSTEFGLAPRDDLQDLARSLQS